MKHIYISIFVEYLFFKTNYVKDGGSELDLLYNFITKNGKYRYAEEGYEYKLRKQVNKIKKSTNIDSLTIECKKYDDIINNQM